MESLVPSEIARLVYGYLVEEHCEAAAQLFLETSSSLKECLILQGKRRKFSTTVFGLSLVDILNLYTDAVCLVKNYLAREESLNHTLNDFVKELGNVLVLDHDSGRNISKTVFLRISVPNKKNARRPLEGIDEEEEEEEEEEKKTENESQHNEQKKSSVTEEPGPVYCDTNTNDDEFDLNILQTMIDNTALHERLAENINKAIDSSGEASNHKTDEKKIIETILHNTEADPIFHELLDELVGPRPEDTTTPEDTDKENGDPAEERQAPNSESVHTANEDLETSKKIEEESNLAIEGILAGNKKMQEEKVNEEPQPTETIVLSTPQAIATSSGVYQQSFIIPAGYTVTDVIPTSQLQTVSTPLQPLKVTNLGTFGHLSPISASPTPVNKKSLIHANLQPRRRRILPKQEASFLFHIPVATDEEQMQEVKVTIPTPQKKLPELIKTARVRTRGGIQKVGTRGVKAIAPVSKPVDNNIRVLVSPGSVKKYSSSSGIKTRAMLRKQEKDKKDVQPSVTETIQPLSNEEPEVIEITEKDPSPEKEKEKEKPKEDCTNNKDGTEATPEQQLPVVKLNRLSLSTPRRAHVRVLDFETPDKNLALKKSLTSPKVYHHNKKEPKTLEFIKRGGMFDSPPKETPKEVEKTEESKSKKGWDSDLRKFMAAGENMDIPTSVGLKRKNGAKKGDKPTNTKRKVTRKKVTKKPAKEKNSNEELVDQIEKEVRDVIGEEEMALNTSQNSELGHLIEQKLLEEMDKDDSSSSLEIIADEKPQSEGSKRPFTPEDRASPIEIIKNVNADNAQQNSESQLSNSEDCTNDAEKQDPPLSERFNTSTPLKLAMSPVNENSRGQLTPTTGLVMSHLGKENNRYASVFSPTSQSSLENILIKECSRMETEKNTSNLAEDIEKLSSPKSDSCGTNPTPESKAADSKKDTSNNGDKELTFESVRKNVSLFQTPAKFLSAAIPSGPPVEMTPLTKVLVSETSFAATVLVTPTLPPTPKNPSSLETPQKTDDSPNGSMNSSKGTGQPQEGIISLNAKEERSLNKKTLETPTSEMNTDVHEPPSSVIDDSININKNCHEKNHGFKTVSKNIDTVTISNPITEKQTCKTPKIKLMSPRPNKTNEPSVRKKADKIIEQRKNSEGNTSKQIHSDTSCEGRNTEKILNLENSNHSEQSDNNKSSERIEGKKIKKQAQRETKKQISSKKKTCLEKNNKSLKKSPKPSNAKPPPKLSIEEEMETKIRNILKDAKAKLFGPDNSSDSDSASDSDSNNDSEVKPTSVQLKVARERLQKLENIKMLHSSSTSEESSDEVTVVEPKTFEKESVSKDSVPARKSDDFNEEDGIGSNSIIQKNPVCLSNKKVGGVSSTKLVTKTRSFEKDSVSKDGVLIKKIEHSHEEDEIECNVTIKKHLESCITKKSGGSSNSKLIESSKIVSKEIEESCESFPTLHLSEESNQSVKLDSHLTKGLKAKKSPSSKNDLTGKKSNSLLLTTSSFTTTHEGGDVEKETTMKDPRKITDTTPSKIEKEKDLNVEPKSYSESHTNEQFFHINNRDETLKSKLSDSVEKLNLARSQAVSEYLDNYVYSFTLDVDKSGNYLSKELKPSPFLDIFHLSENQHHSEHSKKDDRKWETSRSDERTRPRSDTRIRKRNRSASSSEDEREKRDYNRSYGGRGYSGRGRGRDWSHRYRRDLDSSYNRRDPFSRSKYRDRDMRSHHDRYHSYDHHSSHDKKRPRYSSPEPRRTSRKDDRRPVEEKVQSSKYKTYSNINDSHTSSKSGSEADGKHTDINSTYSSERNFDLQKERCSTSSQRLVIDDQPTHSRTLSQSHKSSKLTLFSEKEDGELSDSSEVKRISPEGSRSAVLSMGAHDSRANLLNKVDLDQFLSIVHGKED